MDVTVPAQLSLFPLLNHVLLPTAYARIQISQKARKSVSLLEQIYNSGSKDVFIAVVPGAHLQHGLEDMGLVEQQGVMHLERLLRIGTAARVLQVSRMLQTGDWVILLEGVCRVSIEAIVAGRGHDAYDTVQITQLELKPGSGSSRAGSGDAQIQELGRQLRGTTRQLLRALSKQTGISATKRVLELLEAVPPQRAADVVAAAVGSTSQERLAVLLCVDSKPRIKLALQMVQQALDNVRQSSVPGGGVQRVPGGAPTLQLGGSGFVGGAARQASVQGGEADDDLDDDLEALLLRLQKAQPPPDILKAAMKELRRLRGMSEQQPGFAPARSYLETIADLPWQRTSVDLAREAADASGGSPVEGPGLSAAPPPPLRLQEARAVLDQAHHGLDKVKERIVQYLAVMRLRGSTAKAPILCFIGAPGVGKTSLARSVADVLGRPFVRIALGGVRDESEVRGHRRTYVGALPGRIIQGLRRVGVRDPVMLLDEIDKLGRDAVRGDPASALLEVLDPEQNGAFVDTYLGVPFDLSRVTFVATANRVSEIPAPLLDRMEVLTLSGYTREEKAHIAAMHLVPRLLQEHGLSDAHVAFAPGIMAHIIERHVAVNIVTASDGLPPASPPSNEDLTAMEDSTSSGAGPSAGFVLNSQHHAAEHQAQLPGGTAPHCAGAAAAQSASAAIAKEQPVLAGMTGMSAPSHYGSGDVRLLRPPLAPPRAASEGAASGSGAAAKAPSSSPWQMLWPRGSAATATSTATRASGSSRAGSHGLPEEALAGAVAEAAGQQRNQQSQHGPQDASWLAAAQLQRPAAPPWQHLQQRSGTVPLQATPVMRYNNHRQPLPYPPDLLAQSPSHVVQLVVDRAVVELVLGPARFTPHEAAERVASPGAAAGLVWTAAGGLVQYVECVCISRGTADRPGQLTLTGQVGEVLEESARIALSWIRAHASQLGLDAAVTGGAGRVCPPTSAPGTACGGVVPAADTLRPSPPPAMLLAHARAVGDVAAADPDCMQSVSIVSPALSWDIHVHLPAGGIAKDGPSAGITLAVALISLLTNRCVRADTAMTGELTLRGLVLPVGGVKEKLLAARHAGLARVVVPVRNLRDVAVDCPPALLKGLEVQGAERLQDVLRLVFDPPFELRPCARM